MSGDAPMDDPGQTPEEPFVPLPDDIDPAAGDDHLEQASWTGLALTTGVLLVLLAVAVVTGSVGPALILAAGIGPITMLGFLRGVARWSQQGPWLLAAMFGGGCLLGAAWCFAVIKVDMAPVAGAIAVVALPSAYAVAVIAWADARGHVDESLDGYAMAAAAAFGWYFAFVVNLVTQSNFQGVLDFVSPTALTAVLLPDALLRPVVVSSVVGVVASVWWDRRHDVPRPLPTRWLAASSVIIVAATCVGVWVSDPVRLLVVLGAVAAAGAAVALVAIAHTRTTLGGGTPGPIDPADPRGETDPDSPGSGPSSAGGSRHREYGDSNDPVDEGGGSTAQLPPGASSVDLPGTRTVPRGGLGPRPGHGARGGAAQPRRPAGSRPATGSAFSLRQWLPVLGLVILAWLGWGWLDNLRTTTNPCEPHCGVEPGAPQPPPDQQFLGASGWRVTYSEETDGTPTENAADRVVWSYVENDSSTGDTPLVVGFQGLSTAKDLRDSCDDYSSPQTAGYTLAYAIPNAGLGTFVGVGDVYERVVPVAGKVPRREGLFIMCARVGDVAVVGWAEGTRHPGYSYNGSHADPAYSVAAQTLADFAARVEFLDKSGKPLIA